MRLGFLLLLLIIVAGVPARAQVPPSPAELRVYAGLHAAAARGDVAEIERLIAAGERPDIPDGRTTLAAFAALAGIMPPHAR